MQRIEIHSRRGSMALGVVGVLDAVCAIATLFIYLVTTWGAASIVDRLLQFSLIVSAAGGVYLLALGLANLGVKRVLRHRRASAATSS